MWMINYETIEINKSSDIFQYSKAEYWNKIEEYLTSYSENQPSRGVLIKRCL